MPPGERVMPSHPARSLQILFVYSRDSTFVAIDRKLLSRRNRIRDWPQPRPIVNVFALAAAIRQSDLVFGWFASWHTFWPVMLARLLGRPTVLVIGGYDTASLPDIDYGLQQRPVMGRVSRWVMRHATRLVTNSDYSRREIEANAGIPPSDVEVIHHGVPDPFGELVNGERERVALTVGIVEQRNLERKGLLTFALAASLLPDVQFVVAGRWIDASVEELRAIAPDNLTLTGWVEQDELEALYRRASVYVQASRHEGFGLSVAEAMLAGCIPVVSRAGALPEVVGDAGILLEAEAVAAPELAAGIRRAFALDEGTRERARRRILEQFPESTRGDRLERVIDQALATRGGR
jgi:glycosyltransferase involved in cell wall biosynthesis